MSALADAIAADILRERPETPDLDHCLLCKRAFSEGKGFGLNRRFCSPLCLDAYDAGYVHREPKPHYSLPLRGDGFLIECKGCHKPFVSRGLRCCSIECDRQHRERQEIEAIVAEVGGELPVKRKCEQCGGDIPRYRGVGKARRQVSKAARFCSDKCSARARKQPRGSTPVLSPESVQNPLQDSVSQSAPDNPPIGAEPSR